MTDRRQAGSGQMRRGGRGGTFISPPPDPLAVLTAASLPVWLRTGDDITVAGQGVSQWVDRSGNGNTVTQGTDANRMTYHTAVLDGQAVVRGDGVVGTPKCLVKSSGLTGMALGSKPKLYVVGNFAVATNGGWFCETSSNGTSNNTGVALNHFSTTMRSAAAIGGSIIEPAFTDSNQTTYKLYEARVSATNVPSLRINDAQVVADSAAPSGLNAAQVALTIGALTTQTFQTLNGNIAELIIAYPDATQHTALIAYFRARYPSLGL